MMSIQNKLRQLYEPFCDLPVDVTHYMRMTTYPYVVWSEDGENTSLHTDNHKAEQQLTGTVDYFTKKEFDPVVDQIQDILDDEGVGWTLESVQYEDVTNLIHYSWRWSVI